MTEQSVAYRDRVAVFGGSGFVGSHVADALSDAGYNVRVVDQRPSPWLRPDQEMILADLTSLEQTVAAAEGCQIVYHFAGIADIDQASLDPMRTAQTNVLGTVHTLEAARASGARRYVFASTVYVYSHHGSFYRASKQAAEAFIETYQEQYGLPYTILRYGTLYGRRADHRNRIHQLLVQAVTRGTIDYPGNGAAVREFIHVEDAARLSVTVLGNQYENRHLVLTGQESMRMIDLLKMIKEIMQDRIAISCSNQEPPGHYQHTPYAFRPRLGHKLVPGHYVDLGQGLLDCLAEIVEGNGNTVESVSPPSLETTGDTHRHHG